MVPPGKLSPNESMSARTGASPLQLRAGYWKRSDSNAVAFDDGKGSSPVIAAGQRRNDERLIGFWIRPWNPKQHDATRHGQAETEREFSEIGIAGDRHSLLRLRTRQNRLVFSPGDISLIHTTS
jgi:hypothetical protein